MAVQHRNAVTGSEAAPRDQLILELYRSGTPVGEIARRAAVCVKTVRNVARRAGMPPRNPPQPDRDFVAVSRYLTGEPVAAIAMDLGMSRSRIRLLAQQAGI